LNISGEKESYIKAASCKKKKKKKKKRAHTARKRRFASSTGKGTRIGGNPQSCNKRENEEKNFPRLGGRDSLPGRTKKKGYRAGERPLITSAEGKKNAACIKKNP